jgi:uncharacterized protein VirK/YbjX
MRRALPRARREWEAARTEIYFAIEYLKRYFMVARWIMARDVSLGKLKELRGMLIDLCDTVLWMEREFVSAPFVGSRRVDRAVSAVNDTLSAVLSAELPELNEEPLEELIRKALDLYETQ